LVIDGRGVNANDAMPPRTKTINGTNADARDAILPAISITCGQVAFATFANVSDMIGGRAAASVAALSAITKSTSRTHLPILLTRAVAERKLYALDAGS
jgi:hypothetical protein